MEKTKNGKLSDIKVPLLVSIGENRITLEQLAGMTPGSVFILDKPAGETADILVSGEKVAKAEVVVIDDMFAVRVTEVIKEEGQAYGK